MADLTLSLMVLAVVALLAGAWFLHRRSGARRQVVLMLILAAVIAMNIGLMTWPDARGVSPLQGAPR